jgi:general stress protein CsbA
MRARTPEGALPYGSSVAKPPTALNTLTARVRRAQFIVGLGIVSLVMGMVISGYLFNRVGYRMAAFPSPVAFVFAQVGRSLWVVVVLPAACYGAARILELKPWSTAIGAALTGESFLVALDYIQSGELPWVDLMVRAVALAGGVALSAYGVRRGRSGAARATEAAAQIAAANKAQYDAVLRESQRVADQVESRKQS